MGSNIGTTLTAWIIATVGFKVKIESLALPFIGLGAVGLILFRPGTKPMQVTGLLIGFGLLFLGSPPSRSTISTGPWMSKRLWRRRKRR